MRAYKYLGLFPDPLLKEMVDGRWLPFVGAGFSKNARLPEGKKMPLWNDLGKALGSELIDFEFSSPIDAISHYEHEFGRPRLIERMGQLIFINQAEPDKAHRGFCDLPFDIVCTTNFDFLLEKGYSESYKYCRPIVDEDNLSINGDSKAITLLKVHGDVHHPNKIVMTEQDYDSYISRNPLMSTYIASLLINRTAVFLGYSLEDYDFRQIWQVVTDRLGKSKRMAYVLAVGLSETDIARYSRRGVRVINVPGELSRYNDILHDVFLELKRYWLEKQIEVSRYAEGAQAAELLSGNQISGRICFFNVPYQHISFYREYVSPIIIELGYVPMFESDMFSPGDSIKAKTEAIVLSSSLIIIEPSSTRDINQILYLSDRPSVEGTVSQRSGPIPIIAITDDLVNLPSFREWPRIKINRPNFNKKDDISRFQVELRSVISDFSGSIRRNMLDEPVVLLESKFYNQAVASAFTALEYHLEMAIKRDGDTPVGLSFDSMLKIAVKRGLVPGGISDEVMEWRRIRNLVIHGRRRVGQKEAQTVVNGILKFIQTNLL